MRVALDATPLLGSRSGVGRYVEGLLHGLGDLPGAPEPLLTFFSLRGRLPGPPPFGRCVTRRLPARALQLLWSHVPFPPVELLTGPVDVFHAGNFVLPPLQRATGVLTVHDLAFVRYPDTVDARTRAYRHLVPDAIRRAKRVVTVSEAVRAELCAEYGVDPSHVVVAPNGVEAAWYAARPLSALERTRLGLPERYLVFVGNVEPRKGLATLVQAHAAARRSSGDVPPLALAGAAGWGDPWQGRPPQPADVVRLGFLPDPQLRSLVSGAVALCLPSRYEGFGLPVLEALACGRPVLASDLPAHREVAGELARFVAADDVDGWSQALLEVSAGHEGPGTVAGRRARAAMFTWRRSAAIHLDTWRSAVASS